MRCPREDGAPASPDGYRSARTRRVHAAQGDRSGEWCPGATTCCPWSTAPTFSSSSTTLDQSNEPEIRQKPQTEVVDEPDEDGCPEVYSTFDLQPYCFDGDREVHNLTGRRRTTRPRRSGTGVRSAAGRRCCGDGPDHRCRPGRRCTGRGPP